MINEIPHITFSLKWIKVALKWFKKTVYSFLHLRILILFLASSQANLVDKAINIQKKLQRILLINLWKIIRDGIMLHGMNKKWYATATCRRNSSFSRIYAQVLPMPSAVPVGGWQLWLVSRDHHGPGQVLLHEQSPQLRVQGPLLDRVRTTLHLGQLLHRTGIHGRGHLQIWGQSTRKYYNYLKHQT